MSDEPDYQPRSHPLAGLRKALYMAAFIFVAWVMFGQVGLRMFTEPQSQTADAPAPKRPVVSELLKEKDQQIAQLRDRLDQFDAKLKTFEDVAAATPKTSESVVSDERIAALESKLKQQEEAVAAMKSQLGETQAQSSHRLEALTLFGQLKEAALHGDPFGLPLDRLTQLTQANAQAQTLLTQLKSQSQGAVTLPVLQSRFAIVLPEALSAGQPDGVMHSLQSVIRIRKTGEPQGSDDAAILARAEARVGRGDIDGASKELAALSPPAAVIVSAWTAQAQSWLGLRATLDALQLALTNEQAEPAIVPLSGFDSGQGQ